MLNSNLVEKLRTRYNFHPLIFHRSFLKAKSECDLFDILDSFPNKYPVIWSEEEHRWLNVEDAFLSYEFIL